VNLLQREIVSALIQKSLTKTVMGTFTLSPDYGYVDLAVRADTGHIFRVTFQVSRETFEAQVDAVKKLGRE